MRSRSGCRKGTAVRRRALHLALAGWAAFSAVHGSARAAEPDSIGIRRGDLLRIDDGRRRRVYTFEDYRLDSLVLHRRGGTETRIMSLEDALSVDRRAARPAGDGALTGACIGVIGGALAGILVEQGDWMRDGKAVNYMGGGAVLGALAGAIRPGWRWERIHWTPIRIATVDSTGGAAAGGGRRLRFHVNVAAYAGTENENHPQYETSKYRFLNEVGLKWMRPIEGAPRLESIALAYTFMVGDATYETRHSVGPTFTLRATDRWTANAMAGPLWCRSTNDFGTGVQARAYFVYRGVVSCEGLFMALPPSAEYRAAGGKWETSFCAGVGIHGKPAAYTLLGEAIVGTLWVAAIIIILSSMDLSGLN